MNIKANKWFLTLPIALLVMGVALGCDKNKKDPKDPTDETGGGSSGLSGTGSTGYDDGSGSSFDDYGDDTAIGGDDVIEDTSVPEPPPSVDDESKTLGEQYLAEGLMAAGSGNQTKAKTAFTKSLSADPGSYQAAYNLGVMAEADGNEAQAKKYYKQSMSANPQYGPAVKAYAYLVARQGALSSALDFAASKNGKYPDNPDVATAYAELLVMSGKDEKAIGIAKSALQQDETNVPAMIALARAYLANEQHEFAGFILDMAVKIEETNPTIYYLRGLIFEMTGYPFAAMELYEQAIGYKGDFLEALHRLAVMQINGGSFDKAAANLEKVLVMMPDSPEVHLNIGEAYRGMRSWDKAHNHLTKAEDLGADKVSVTLNLAFLYFAADALAGLDRIKILEKARTRFLQFRDLVGAKAANQALDIDLTLKQIDKMIKIQKKLADKKKKAAEAAASGDGGDDGEDIE